MKYYLPPLPENADDTTKLAYASLGAVMKIASVLATLDPHNAAALRTMLADVGDKYGQGDSEAAQWIRDVLPRNF